MEEGVIGATELLDAEVVVVDEALEGFCAVLHRAHFDAAAHAVKSHRDHGVAGLPTNGAILGIVQNRPNAGLGLDEGLIAIVVVLGHKVVNRGVLVEVVGGVGFAFGSGAISNIIVGIRSVIRGDQLIANVVAVLLIVLGGAAAEEIIGVDVRGIGGVGDGGEKVAMGFVSPCDHGVIGIGQLRLEVRSRQIRPLEAIGFQNAPCGGIINDGLLAVVVHRIALFPPEDVPMMGEGFWILHAHLLR